MVLDWDYLYADIKVFYERFDYILDDANSFLILTQNSLKAQVSTLPNEKLLCIGLDNDLYDFETAYIKFIINEKSNHNLFSIEVPYKLNM